MRRCVGCLATALFLVCAVMPSHGQSVFDKILQPDAVGGSFVATHLDGLGEASAAGPGLNLFLKYNIAPKFFLRIGTGIHTIYDDVLTYNLFKSTLFPVVNMDVGYELISDSPFAPYILVGLQAFGFKSTVGSFTSDTYYDGGISAGLGFRYQFNDQWAVHAGGQYRYIFTATSDPKPKHWIAQAGVSYALKPPDPGQREEIEYPLGEGEIALDDLFREETDEPGSEQDILDELFGESPGESSPEDDALALLFQPEEESSTAENTPMTEFNPDDYSNAEVSDLITRIQTLQMSMEDRLQQIESLQSQVRANERAIAAITGRVAGDYASIPGGSFGVMDASAFKENYEAGLQQFYDKQYREAIRIFSGLMTSNPDHRLASNCDYWIGECFNAMGEYRNALDSFGKVMNYRTSYKFDDALLMSGLCYLKMGDRITARENFQELVSRFPDSEYAPKAMRYLGRL